MNTVLSQFTLSVLLGSTCLAADFYVAPDGKDSNPGTRSTPFATFERAKQAARKERMTHPTDSLSIVFKEGEYTLTRPLEFQAEDSGASADKPVVYKAEHGKPAIFNCGRKITGLEADPKHSGVWRAHVAQPNTTSDPSWRFQQLWVNRKRADRARTPNDKQFFNIFDVTEQTGTADLAGVHHVFSVSSENLSTLKNIDPKSLNDVHLVAYHNWDVTREPLLNISVPEGKFTTSGQKMQAWNPMNRESRFFLENYPEALDSPGEWFLDKVGWLYYKPRPGEDMLHAEVVAPVLESVMAIHGSLSDSNRWVQHLRFEGLTFRYVGYRIPNEGLHPAQAAMNVNETAVMLDGARDIQFTDCAIEHIGMTAFWFRQACRECGVQRTRMFDLGISGVRIGEMDLVPEPVRTGNITIDNCIIQSGGRTMAHAVGVWIGHSADNAITHCDIGDFFYTAVSVGWRWGYDESGAKRNRVEYNHIHHLGYRVLSDMGGVYTLGPSSGTSIRHNVIHDVYALRYGGWGLYPDEGSTGILYEDNLVYNVRDGSVHQHYGRENVFRNNIFAFSDEGQIALTRAEPHLSFTFERNIVVWDKGHLLGYAGWEKGAKVDIRSNLYWQVEGKQFDFAGKSWDKWQKDGRDEGSVIADPKFADLAHRDFRLTSTSPAAKIGFRPFDISKAGVYGDKAWKKLADIITLRAAN